MSSVNYSLSLFWDAFCLASIGGIWPRFIEPQLLKVTSLEVLLPVKKSFKFLQISDLHFNGKMSARFLKKLVAKVANESPDAIAITGDFLCHGRMHDVKQLNFFLESLKAPLGIFAVLGNHDYDVALGINEKGDYDVREPSLFPVFSALNRLGTKTKLTGKITEAAKRAKPHPDLLKALQEASITLLDNETVLLENGLQITGLGEYMAGKTDPEKAFRAYKAECPGMVLVHNPDAVSLLGEYPGSFVLSGHTHGGQINIPGIWRRLTAMENPLFKSGLYALNQKQLYISRGVGGVVPFRFNAAPELVSLHIKPLE